MRQMADDPNRDILPVKDDSCYGSVRCSSEIDPRERHVVCKLDRYQLEDRYLRLLEEVQGLKKLSNSQEDKIKKLATKLMRSAASRTCPAVLTINDEREKITRLELENSRLKDKAYTLKNQLLSHRGPRSPLRCRRVASGISSGPTTYRSESARTKYQPQPRPEVDDNDTQNYLVKIEELETQRNGMLTRIAELESQISVRMAGVQREKVQDNVEYIRMWRQMKQSNDKLISVQAANETLNAQIGDLKRLLEETTKNNREVTAALVSEKQRLSEMDDKIISVKDSQLSLREKDEQIRDLTNELKILQQHNNELISLSSKFGKVEVENIELKRKVAEYVQDNQSLKSAFSSEQADHAALRTANDKLIRKIEELQRNMDSLTMQLMTFQNEGEKCLLTKSTQTEIKHVDKKTGTSFVAKAESVHSEEDKMSVSESDADDRKLILSKKTSGRAKTKKISDSVETEAGDRSVGQGQNIRSVPTSVKNSCTMARKNKDPRNPVRPSMSREKILMLLDQAQISTPLEAQNAARMRQIDVSAGQNDASKYPESYRVPLTTQQRCFTADISSTSDYEDYRIYEQNGFFDPRQMFSTFLEILKDYCDRIHGTVDNSCACGDSESGIADRIESGNCEEFKYRSERNLNSELKHSKGGQEKTCTVVKTGTEGGRHLLHKFTETECCTCDSDHRCQATSDCVYGCCTLETDHNLALLDKDNFSCTINPEIVKARVGEIGSTIQKTFDAIYMERFGELDCDCIPEYLDHENKVEPLDPINQRMDNKISKVVSRELKRCEELLRAHYDLNSDCKKKKNVSNCEAAYQSGSECGDNPVFCDITAFPLLIKKDQGLVEIHIQTLQLSTKARQILLNENLDDLSIFISWDIWGQETAFTPMQKYPSLSFNSSSVYRVSNLQSFFDSVLREKIVFQVHAISNPDKATFTIAKAKLGVKDILDYPQNKLHYVTPVFSDMPCSCGGNFGQLSLWIRLSCDIDLVENFKDRCGLASALSKHRKMDIPEPGSSGVNKRIFLPIDSNNVNPYSELTTAPVQEVPQFQKTHLGDVPEVKSNRLDTIRELAEPRYRVGSGEKIVKKNKYRYQDPVEEWPKTNVEHNDSLTNSIAANENYSQNGEPKIDENLRASTTEDTRLEDLKKRYDNSEQIESGSITEFNKVLSNRTDSPLRKTGSAIEDLGAVISDDKWDTYKRNSESISISLPGTSADSDFARLEDSFTNRTIPPTKDTITISIVAMSLFDKTSLMNDPDVDLLYVEYSFIGQRGADMETVSLPKPTKKGESMVFNFTRSFQIDEEYHYTQRNMLIAMLTGIASPIIRFFIVTEPHPEEVDTKECDEVGYADFNIREYALGDGLRVVPLIIMNPEQSEQLGMLKITIDGIEIIRNCMMVQKRI